MNVRVGKIINIPVVLALFMLLIVGVAYFDAPSAYAFAGGSGTAGDPYQISSPAELASLSSYSGVGNADKYFILTDNIDLNVSPYNTGAGWAPITNFYGQLDGNDKTINNLYINSSSTARALFGTVYGSGEIKDLTISNANITSGQTSGILIGQLIGAKTISNITTSGSITSSNGVVGGIIGAAYTASTLIQNVHSSATVSGGTGTSNGGIVGSLQATGITVTQSSFTGALTGGYRTGGIIGSTNSGITISKSYSNATITSSLGETGGIAGALYGIIIDSYSRSSITSPNLAKGG